MRGVFMSKQTSDYDSLNISGSLSENLSLFKEIFRFDDVLRIRHIKIARKTACALLYMDGMADSAEINESVVRPLVRAECVTADTAYISQSILFANESVITACVGDMLRAVLYGDTIILIDGQAKALTVNTKGWRTRSITEPNDERVLQGPREGFGEAAMFNLAMLRRKLLTPDLCIEMLRMGRRTDTLVFVCYLKSLVNVKILCELKRRMKRIEIDGVLDSNYISESIRDHRLSLFKTIGTTERPDIVAARLLEGRIAVVVDGTPVVLTLPYLFSESFQSDEDYYLNFLVASVGRLLRYICFFLAVSVPAVFLALSTHHLKLLPTHMALSVAQLRRGVPMSSVTECVLLILVFEILQETGIRMPQGLGHALSIVGGLVVGQAAVEARIISAPMLIAVALSGIAGLMIPRLKGAVFYLKLISVAAAALFGLYGCIAAGCIFLFRIFGMSSFGVDYTVSLVRPSPQHLKDSVLRAPWWRMIERPCFNKNKTRQGRYRK